MFIHGSYGNPNENWFPWLANELKKKGFNVIIPAFPTPLKQSFHSWEIQIKPHLDKINENTAIIAHSSGVIFILKIIEKYNLKP